MHIGSVALESILNSSHLTKYKGIRSKNESFIGSVALHKSAEFIINLSYTNETKVPIPNKRYEFTF